MKAIGYRTKGGVEVLTDIELPRPTPGPRDLLVAVKAVSVNPVDTKRRQRESPETAPGYRVLGYDAAGTVEAVGTGVSLFKPGDEVFYAGAMDRPGTNAEFHLVDERIAGPILLARRFDSYIEGFALQPALSELLAVDIGGGFAPESFKQDRVEDAQKTKAIFESFMHDHGVPRSDPAMSGLSFGWLDDAPEGEGTVGSYGRVFDLIVLSRPDPTSFGLDRRVLESGLFESGRPILLSPPAPPKQIATNILIAWNGSTEQTRAIAFAMPLLQQAESVKVLTIPGGAGVPGPSGEQLTRCLERNGIVAIALIVELDGRSTGETILATAALQDCDLLIKGAYTQSRLREWIFGGATRHIVANATLPVLMAH